MMRRSADRTRLSFHQRCGKVACLRVQKGAVRTFICRSFLFTGAGDKTVIFRRLPRTLPLLFQISALLLGPADQLRDFTASPEAHLPFGKPSVRPGKPCLRLLPLCGLFIVRPQVFIGLQKQVPCFPRRLFTTLFLLVCCLRLFQRIQRQPHALPHLCVRGTLFVLSLFCL